MAEQERMDIDPQETREWLDSLETLFDAGGPERAHFILETLIDKARRSGAYLPYEATTAYLNTIPVSQEPVMPGDQTIENRVRAAIRWNALAMVLRASNKELDLGGHISTFASSAMIYDVGFNHFFRAPGEDGGDFLFVQGHGSPGIYSRAFLEGRISEEQLEHFRQEVGGKGLSSYPHPHLMPDFWQFPTVSMGLGPITGIYQARFMKYLEVRGFNKVGDRKVWVFMGDVESDEPESLSALSLASREHLDKLIFVVNCNLQRLDGPVRGNGKIIQELEGKFRGAGWNVIKVIWGTEWDSILERDTKGELLRKLSTMVDGEFQAIQVRGPAYLRERIFGGDEYLESLIQDKSDKDLWQMTRGGHDPRKIYSAFAEAVKHKGEPTVILFKTIKGYGLGSGEASMGAHNLKSMSKESLLA